MTMNDGFDKIMKFVNENQVGSDEMSDDEWDDVVGLRQYVMAMLFGSMDLEKYLESHDVMVASRNIARFMTEMEKWLTRPVENE